MKEFITAFDRLPKILKILLCIPMLDVIWAVYRILKGIYKKDNLLVVVGILWIVPGSMVCWIFDIITVLLYDHPKLA